MSRNRYRLARESTGTQCPRFSHAPSSHRTLHVRAGEPISSPDHIRSGASGSVARGWRPPPCPPRWLARPWPAAGPLARTNFSPSLRSSVDPVCRAWLPAAASVRALHSRGRTVHTVLTELCYPYAAPVSRVESLSAHDCCCWLVSFINLMDSRPRRSFGSQ